MGVIIAFRKFPIIGGLPDQTITYCVGGFMILSSTFGGPPDETLTFGRVPFGGVVSSAVFRFGGVPDQTLTLGRGVRRDFGVKLMRASSPIIP